MALSVPMLNDDRYDFGRETSDAMEGTGGSGTLSFLLGPADVLGALDVGGGRGAAGRGGGGRAYC